MKVIIDVAAYYEWEPCATPVFIYEKQNVRQADGTDKLQDVIVGAKLDGEEIPLSDIKQNHVGVWLEKVLVERETHTDIAIPECQIVDLVAHFARKGVKKTRKQIVAEYLAEKIMPDHAHPEHYFDITVEDEPANKPAELAAFLKMYFEVSEREPAEQEEGA